MKDILNHLFSYKSFSRTESEQILTDLAKGKFNPSQMAAFLAAYAMRNITVPELQGFRDAMLNLCIPVSLEEFDPIDVCGTGGDGKNTFNISTLSSFVLSGAGYKVAKHGNYGISSISGSSNIMEYFGFRFTNHEDHLKETLDKTGICFLHAPLFHPAMKSIAPIRRELGVKTFFNMLGPLVNPAKPKVQMVGVFNLELARIYHHLFQESDSRYIILHSLDGYDEISLTDDIKIFSNQGEYILDHTLFTSKALESAKVKGGNTMEESADIFLKILEGNGTEAQTQVVLANTAMAISCYYPEKPLGTALEEARNSLHGKKALNSFRKLLEINKNQN